MFFWPILIMLGLLLIGARLTQIQLGGACPACGAPEIQRLWVEGPGHRREIRQCRACGHRESRELGRGTARPGARGQRPQDQRASGE